MIISCEKCNKKFELDTSLIPDTGRLLQCGSCSHKWHYKRKKNIVSLTKPAKINKDETQDDNIIEDNIDKKPENPKTYKKKETKDKYKEGKKNLKKTGFLNILLVILISFVAIILVIETFKFEISKLVPNIDFYLYSLYESVKDIYLFFKDLLK